MTPALRVLRAGTLSAAAVALGAAGHAVVAGALPSLGAVAGIWIALWMAVWCVAGWRLSGRSIVGVLAGGQAMVHGAGILTASQQAAAGHHIDPVSFVCALDPGVGHGHTAWALAAMLSAHVLATAVAAWWLSRGESWLWTAVRRAGTRILRTIAVRLGRATGSAEVTWIVVASETRVVTRLGAAATSRRGPPALTARA